MSKEQINTMNLMVTTSGIQTQLRTLNIQIIRMVLADRRRNHLPVSKVSLALATLLDHELEKKMINKFAVDQLIEQLKEQLSIDE